MAAVSFAGIKNGNPSDKDLSDLYYVVEYLRAMQDIGHILHTSVTSALRLYCEVDASYLLHPDSKGHTGYTISFYGTTGTFHNRSVKQTAVATSSTHAEARAIFTLAKELNFLIALCQELHKPLELPAIIMEDNSAVVTMANSDTGYTKKCKHFLMVLNCIKEQINRSAQDIWKTQQRRHAHQASLFFGLRAHGSQDPRTTCTAYCQYTTPSYSARGKYVRA